MATLITLVTFNTTDGREPFDSLIFDANGNLLGTTLGGGAFDHGLAGSANGDGTVFEVAYLGGGSYASTPTTLVNFDADTGGANPAWGSSLFADANGNLFGTTDEGGAGFGTVYEIAYLGGGSYASTPTTLVSFGNTDGSQPNGALIADADGNLFGTTYTGGANNLGTVYEIAYLGGGSYASTPTTLATFDGSNGQQPLAGLVADATGDLFGTTVYGGQNSLGTVFELVNNGGGSYTLNTLVSFNDDADGFEPYAALTVDAAGNLFGTTYLGGDGEHGTVFELLNNGGTYTFITLVRFNGTDGANPQASVTIDAAGNLFGTTYYGGASNNGTVYEIAYLGGGSYASTPITLTSFDGGNNANPIGGVIADSAGNLFGTTNFTSTGGTGDGTVWELTGSGFQSAFSPVSGGLLVDTGSSATDNVTSNSMLIGKGATTLVTISEGDTTLGTATPDAYGNWSFMPDGLVDGTHTLLASTIDHDGNDATVSMTFTLDTAAPTVSLGLANDTGISASDNLTSDSTLLGFADAPTPGDEALVTISEGDAVLGMALTDASGNWSFLPEGLTDGQHTLIATTTDLAGNTGTTSFSFTLDTTAPTLSGALIDDTGSSASDHVTSDPAISGFTDLLVSSFADFPVTILDHESNTVLGTAIPDATGEWQFTPDGLTDGTHTLIASQSDEAGNIGLAFVQIDLDTTAPILTETLVDDTGDSNSDFVTSNPAIFGFTDLLVSNFADFLVTISEGDTVLGTAMPDASGEWKFTPQGLTDGSHLLTVSETDAAGNTGVALLEFTLDTTAPTVSAGLLHDTGSSDSDGVTSDPTLAGISLNFSKIKITENDVVLGTTTSDASGNWSFLAQGLADGEHTLTAMTTDLAGNAGTASLSFMLDTTAPTLSVGLLHDTGSSDSDGVTSDPTLSGISLNFAKIEISENDVVLGTATPDAAGNWSFTPEGLADGGHTLTAMTTDLAGNTGTASLTFTLDTSGATSVDRDFNADGTSDLLFQHTDGNLAMWLMNGATVAGSSIFAFADPSAWSVRGTGDFNGDGMSDILWQDPSGDIATWQMDGATVAASTLLGFADPSWQIRTTGDFDGNGTSDILFQSTDGNLALWQTSGGTVDAGTIFAFADPAVWSVRGAGDFNGDGKADILWQDPSGNIAIWEMNGPSVAASGLAGFADPAWQIRGTGDFNGDGTSDILFQDTNGNLAMWLMNGLTISSTSIFAFADPSVWHIAGIGDFNGDGKSDILWQDISGNIATWQMNGPNVASSDLVGFADPSWQIVPPDSTGDLSAGAAGGSALLFPASGAATLVGDPAPPHPTFFG